MSNIYNSLSEIYEGMYQTFIDYEQEFNFYDEILSRYRCKSVVEIGCGTGNLANRFIDHNLKYTGIDISEDMLSIAKKKYPSGVFLKEDMREFKLPEKTDACIITGRSISYLITNKDVRDTLRSINKNLKPAAIVCFDCIDANKFIPEIKEGEKVIHKASYKDKKYYRESYWSINFGQSWTFDWLSLYFEEDEGGSLTKIGEDHSIIRAFSKDEMTLFLKLTGFDVKEIIERPSYAFDTLVVVAEKVT